MKEQLSERYMRTLLGIVYDIVRVLSKSHYTLVSELIDGVKERVEYEVSIYQQKYDGDVVSDVIINHDTLILTHLIYYVKELIYLNVLQMII